MKKSVAVVRKPEYDIEKPKSVSKIDKKFIMEFAEIASQKDKKWIILTLEREIEDKGKKKGFFSFRSQFAHKFFPEIIAANNPKKEQPSFLDEMKAICA